MDKTIDHIGRVASITPEVTTVEIISQSACAGCHARTLCGLSENVTKTVDVPTDPYAGYEVGEQVRVVLSRTMGHKAVWISYVIPLIILLILILSLSRVSGSEFVAGLGGIAGVAIWYFVVWIFRDKLSDSFTFTIEKL